MRVRMLRTTGGPDASVCHLGEVYDLPEGLARQWVALGRAIADADTPEAPVIVMTRDPVVQAAPTPSRKRR